MTLDCYYGDQAEQFSFYRIPKVLFTDKRFKDLSAEAKILYGLLLDRMSLSAKNGWLDQEGRVYIIYTVEDIMDAFSCASQKAMKLLNELEDKCGLIERKRQGLGKPNLIYVKNFVTASESKFKNGENQNSGVLKIETQEFPKSKGSNTEKNNTDLNDTESLPFTSFRDNQKRESKRNDAERRAQYRELIMENISYDVLLLDLPYDKEIIEEILELIVDTVCTPKETVRISGDDKPAEVVRSRFLKLDSEHIRFVVSCMKENTTKIKNIRQYLLATLYVGRVVSPTLALIVQREVEIDAFKPEPFYAVTLGLPEFEAGSERMKSKADAETLSQSCANQTAVVIKLERKDKSEKPPALYDLTALQRDANRILGFTAQQTLDYLQSLYEKKLCTYPRTDSRYLTSDMADGLPVLVSNVAAAMPKVGGIPIHVNAAQVINDKKVSDHHAVIPTANFKETALTGLPAGERAVLELVALRLLCAVAQPHEYTETAVTLECAGHSFSAKGRTVMNPGWRALTEAYHSGKGENESSDVAKALPSVDEWQTFTVHSAAVKEGKTTPPKHYTEDTLLSAMEVAGAKEMPEDAERKGLGMPATRAAILEKLVTTGFVERKKSKKTVSLILNSPPFVRQVW